jgi:hypothetical protein
MLALRHVAAVALLAFAGGNAALAQSAAPPASPVASEGANQALSVDVPIETLVATPSAKAVLDADVPGLTTHPAFDKFKHESLRSVAPKFGGAITAKDVAKVQADLAALPQSMASR